MYRSFRSDPGYLTRYHVKSAVALVGLVGATAALMSYLGRLDAKSTWLFAPALLLLSSTNIVTVTLGFAYCVGATAYLGWSWSALGWLPLSALSVLLATSFLHNASHDNIKPKWLRRPVGEFCGLLQLVGFADWVVIHVIHHSHSDDPERDPHPPLHLGYWKFMMGMRQSILQVLVKEYFGLFGKSEATMGQLKKLALASKAEQILKVAFWFLLLGPSAFTFFFVSSIVLKMLHYAWFNYATHRPSGERNDTVNLNKHLYKLVNAVSFGLYYHRNHHLNPKLFDPRKFKPRQAPAPAAESGQERVA